MYIIIFILPTFTTRAGRDFCSSFSTSFVNQVEYVCLESVQAGEGSSYYLPS